MGCPLALGRRSSPITKFGEQPKKPCRFLAPTLQLPARTTVKGVDMKWPLPSVRCAMAALNIFGVVVQNLTHAYQVLKITQQAMHMDLTQRVALLTRLDKAIQDAEDQRERAYVNDEATIHSMFTGLVKTLQWIRDGDN